MIRRLFTSLILFCCGSALAAPDSLVLDRFDMKLKIDAGQIVNGFYVRKVEFQPVNRNTVVLSENAKYGDAWEFNAGFEGILWWPFGASDLGLPPEQRTVRVEPRLSQAKAKLKLIPESNKAYVELGFFPYKYNSDAHNLGEYLYRSGTYPGVIQTTDGLHLMDHAAYDAYGLHAHLSLMDGLIEQEFNLFTEPNLIPTGDLTPAYEASLSGKLFQIGVGAAYNRLISYNSASVRPHASTDENNRYIEVDSTGTVLYRGPYSIAPYRMQQFFQHDGDSLHTVSHHYYTQRGLKLMARAAVDLGFLLPEQIRGPQDLRIFTEAAVLGVEDQPYYYDDIWRRIPVMAGINIPTFKYLDILSFQMEYYRSLFNNDEQFIANSYPVWNPSAPRYRRDDWKWSVYTEKTVGKLFKIYAQVANDHVRLPEFTTNLSATDLTVKPSHWYYLIRLEFGG